MTPNQYFDKIYCINLDRRADRWQNMAARFERLGITVERVPAVDAVALEIPPYKALIETNRRIFKNALFNGFQNILIIEDDCAFHKDFLTLFDQQTANIPVYDAWFLGAIISDLDRRKTINDYFYDGQYCYTTTAMAYRNGFLTRFLNFLNEDMNLPIDCQLSERIYAQRIVSFNPQLVVQDDTLTDIPNSNQTYKKFNRDLYE